MGAAPREASEGELLRLAREHGDAAAIEALILRQLDRVYSVCLAMVRDPEVAAELSQDTVVRLFTSFDRYRGDCAWSTWTFRVARNLCLNWREKMREEPGDDGDALAAHSAGPLEQAVAKERARALQRGLDGLDELEREALLLHYEAGLPVGQITELLGLNNRTGARGLLQRARRKLRNSLLVSLADDTLVRREGPSAPAPLREAAERTLHELTRSQARNQGREPALRTMGRRQRLLD